MWGLLQLSQGRDTGGLHWGRAAVEMGEQDTIDMKSERRRMSQE